MGQAGSRWRRARARGRAAASFPAGSVGLVGLVGLVGVVVAGCTAPVPDQPRGVDDQVEVFTWWASGSEKPGLDALVATFTEQHPGTRFVNGAIAGGAGSAAKDLLLSRLANDDPPDTFQVHGGAELREHVEAGRLEALDGVFTETGLDDALPDVALDLLTVDGSVYAVPSNIHRANLLWSNVEVLEAAGVDPRSELGTMEEWFDALEAVARTGTTPLAVGSTWTQVHLLEQVLLAHLGAAGYTGLWDGSTDPSSAEVTAALEDFDRLLTYTNADRDRLDWQDAAQRVRDGDAAFTVMGDWALVAMEEMGTSPPEAVLWAPAPGTAGTYNLILDAFTLPTGAAHPESARRWLATVASAPAQGALSRTKGSIPARQDVDLSADGDYQRDALESFRSDVVVPSLTHGTAADSRTLDAVSAAVARFTSGSTVAVLQAELVAALR